MPAQKRKNSMRKFLAERAAAPYGRRHGSGDPKGLGFFGALKRGDGSNKVSTELSLGLNINGKETQVPALVPTLTREEKNYLVNEFQPERDRMPMSIMLKAKDYAQKRIEAGISPFYDNAGIQNRKKGKKPVPVRE